MGQRPSQQGIWHLSIWSLYVYTYIYKLYYQHDSSPCSSKHGTSLYGAYTCIRINSNTRTNGLAALAAGRARICIESKCVYINTQTLVFMGSGLCSREYGTSLYRVCMCIHTYFTTISNGMAALAAGNMATLHIESMCVYIYT